MKSTREFPREELTIGQFNTSLVQWGESELSSDETNSENITEAKRRILEAYQGYLDYKANPRNNGFSSSRSLKLSNLRLNSLPDVIFQIKDLWSLDIGNDDWLGRNKNKISKISPLIANLSKLKKFRFNHNIISTLPDEIGELTELQELGGQYNQLTSLPESIGKLSKLESVFLPNNKITKIPAEIKKCKQLKYLTLNNNYLDDLSLYHASQSGTQEVERFLEIYGNPNLLIDPRIYYQCYGGRISDFNMNADYSNHFNKYHLHFLLNDLLLKNKLVGEWFINKMILKSFSGYDNELLAETISNLKKVLINFTEKHDFNFTQKEQISEYFFNIFTTIYEKRNDSEFLKRIGDICHQGLIQGDDPLSTFTLFQLKICFEEKKLQEISQLRGYKGYDYYRQGIAQYHILDLAKKKCQEIRQTRPSFKDDIFVYNNYLRVFKEKFGQDQSIQLFSSSLFPDSLFQDSPQSSNKEFLPSDDLIEQSRLFFKNDSRNVKSTFPLMANEIAKDIYRNSAKRFPFFEDFDFVKKLKNFTDQIGDSARESLREALIVNPLNEQQIELINKKILDLQIAQLSKLIELQLEKKYQLNATNDRFVAEDQTTDFLSDKSIMLTGDLKDQLLRISTYDQRLIAVEYKQEFIKFLTEFNKTQDNKIPPENIVNFASSFQKKADIILQQQVQILTQAKKLYQDQILFDENIRRIEEETLKLTKAIDEITIQKETIDQEIREEKLLKQGVENFLGGIIDEIEQEEQQRYVSQETLNSKIKAMEVASTLTSEIFDRELRKIEKEQIAEEIIRNIGDEVIEESSLSSQLDLVEKRIDNTESKIAESQRIWDARLDLVSSKVDVDPDQRSSFDRLQSDPSSSPRVSKLIEKFQDPENKNDNSLRRASCCPIRFSRSSNFTRLREMFSGIKSSRKQ
jgi:Leucine-rich repeat (LRR) protein